MSKSAKRPYGSGYLKVENGVWIGRVRAQGKLGPRTPVGPERTPGTREGLSPVQAEKEWAKLRAALGALPPTSVGALSLEEAGRRLLLHMEGAGRTKKSTRDVYASTLRVHLVPGLPTQLAEITAEDVETYMARKARPGEPPEAGRSHKSIYNDVAILNRVFTFARRKRWVVINPCEEVERKRADPDAIEEIRYLDRAHVDALVRAAADCRRHGAEVRARMLRLAALRAEGLTWRACAAALGVAEPTVYYYRSGDPEELDPDRVKMAALDAALITTAAWTGLREGELIALRWRDVDYQGEQIVVARNYSRATAGFTTPKSRKSRVVPMLDQVAIALARYEQQSAYQAPDDLVFAHPETGRPLDGSKLLKRFKSICLRAGVDEHRFHDLRHTFATWLASEGVDLIEIREYLGHADIATTERYAKFRPSGDRKARLQGRFDAEPLEQSWNKLSESGGNSEPLDPSKHGGLL